MLPIQYVDEGEPRLPSNTIFLDPKESAGSGLGRLLRLFSIIAFIRHESRVSCLPRKTYSSFPGFVDHIGRRCTDIHHSLFQTLKYVPEFGERCYDQHLVGKPWVKRLTLFDLRHRSFQCTHPSSP